MSEQQVQDAYKLAVRSSLMTFYGKSDAEAELLVKAWWVRISSSSDFASGMYLHTEALGTATDLAKVKEIRVTDLVRKKYLHILEESNRSALHSRFQAAKAAKNRQEQKAYSRAG